VEILLFTQIVLLISKVNVQNTPTHVNSRRRYVHRDLSHAQKQTKSHSHVETKA